jgi:hypothetical protein
MGTASEARAADAKSSSQEIETKSASSTPIIVSRTLSTIAASIR